MCVTGSVHSECSVLMGCNCFVFAIAGLLRAVWRRRMFWGRMKVVLAELYLVLRERACFRQKKIVLLGKWDVVLFPWSCA